MLIDPKIIGSRWSLTAALAIACALVASTWTARADAIKLKHDVPSESAMVAQAPGAAESVVILELNDVKLYVPRLWIWWNRTDVSEFDFRDVDPPLRADSPPLTVHRASGYYGFTLFPRAYENRERFSQLPEDFWVFRLEVKRGRKGLSEKGGQGIERLGQLQDRLRPVDADGFRRWGDGDIYFGANPGDTDPGGSILWFNCDSPHRATPLWCFNERSVIDGLVVKYVWVGEKVQKSDWRRMDRRVQALIEWLATSPEQRGLAPIF